MAISSDDVRNLLAAEEDAVLVLIEGRAEITGEDSGALEVISRADLVERLGDDTPADSEIDDVAATLDAAIAELGG